MVDENRKATRPSIRAGTIGERVAVLESKMDSTGARRYFLFKDN